MCCTHRYPTDYENWVLPGQLGEAERRTLLKEKIAKNPGRKKIGPAIQEMERFQSKLVACVDAGMFTSNEISASMTQEMTKAHLYKFTAAIIGNVVLKPADPTYTRERIRAESLALLDGIKQKDFWIKDGDVQGPMILRPLRIELLKACGHSEEEADRLADST